MLRHRPGQLGLDHEKLIYHTNGRTQRITDGRPARVVYNKDEDFETTDLFETL